MLRHLLSAFVVGVTRLELATSRPPDAYSNQLSYTPNYLRVVTGNDSFSDSRALRRFPASVSASKAMQR